MLKVYGTLAAAALTLALALPAHAEDAPTTDTVVATVNGAEITMGHMITARANLPQEYQQLPDDVLWDGVLNQLIQQTLLAQTDGVTETKGITLALDNLRRELLASTAIARISGEVVTEDALQAAYAAKYVSDNAGLEYNAAHILVDSEDEALALVTELDAGRDFAELAREKSTGPSGPNGGALGWFARGMMVAPFQAAVEGLDVGGISAPVQTQFGWHVIKLNETRPVEAPALDAVRAELEDDLRRKALTSRLQALEADSTVTRIGKDEIDTSMMSNVGLLEE
ncbi:MAG: peptidylprolyl isomerase [Rhodobacteraceae bacterium]|nr:peptidylprolyl isomerase [Paracoccaceae bacterium]